MSEKKIEVNFVKTERGLMATDRIEGRVAFPDWRGEQPAEGEWWEVEIAGENPAKTVHFLRCVKKLNGPPTRLAVSDSCGSGVLGVFLLDGTPAVEGRDYTVWTGEYHKNGKWSYSEGGIDSRVEIWAVINQRSTHSAGDNQKRFVGLNVAASEGKTVVAGWCGPWVEVPTKPACPDGVPAAVYQAAMVLVPVADRERWDHMEGMTRYAVNDSCGSSVMGVFLPDGTMAVEGRDYLPWSGEYYKNGKWSYQEGGIASRTEVWFVVNHRSTHSAGDNQKSIVGLHVAADNGQTVTVGLCGPWAEEPTKPACPCSVPEPVYKAALLLAPPEHQTRWSAMTGTTRYSVNDAYGSAVIVDTIVLADGTPAVEGKDYLSWTGEYHKNGKWSYSAGGIASRSEVWFVVNNRSTHRMNDNQKSFVGLNVASSSGQTLCIFWCAGWNTSFEPAACPQGVPQSVYLAILAATQNARERATERAAQEAALEAKEKKVRQEAEQHRKDEELRQGQADGLGPVIEAVGGDVETARKAKDLAEAAVLQCGGRRAIALSALRSQATAPYGRARRQAGLRESIPGIEETNAGSRFLGQSRSADVDALLAGAVAWLDGTPALADPAPEAVEAQAPPVEVIDMAPPTSAQLIQMLGKFGGERTKRK